MEQVLCQAAVRVNQRNYLMGSSLDTQEKCKHSSASSLNPSNKMEAVDSMGRTINRMKIASSLAMFPSYCVFHSTMIILLSTRRQTRKQNYSISRTVINSLLRISARTSSAKSIRIPRGCPSMISCNSCTSSS